MAKEKLNKIKVLKIMKKFKSELYHESSRIWFDKDQVHTIDIYGDILTMFTTHMYTYDLDNATPEVLQEFLNRFKVFQIIKDLESFIQQPLRTK